MEQAQNQTSEEEPAPIRAPGATTKHHGNHWLPTRIHGQQRTKNRFRLTRAVARGQQSEKLIDLFESAKAVLSVETSEPGTIGPVDLAKAKREHGILRAELLRRGVEAELLDWTGEELNESEEADDENRSVEESVAV